MAQAFYMDVHVPSAVTVGLRRRDVDVMTSQEDGTQEADDVALLQRATDLGRALFTQDDDLLAIAASWQQEGREFAGVVYSHQLGPEPNRSGGRICVDKGKDSAGGGVCAR